MPLKPGDILANHYRIEAEIDRGAYGRVYRARDTKLDRPVAIKELAKGMDELGSSIFSDYVRRFEREARVQAGFNHPNIVHVYELIQESADRLYLVMEYVDGESLRDTLARRGPLPIDEAVRITSDILAGLAAVHADPRDIVHRDIKPSNVLLSKNGQAKLADFGLAQVGDESMRSEGSKSQPGTSLYMSPEQETSNAYLYPASDLFSIGCVLFEMLTGVPYKRAKKERKGLAELRPDAPPWLDEIVAAALAKDPDERPKDGAEMGRLLAAEKGKVEAEVKAQAEADERTRQEARRKAEEEAERAHLAELERQRQESEEREQQLAAQQAQAEAMRKTEEDIQRQLQAEEAERSLEEQQLKSRADNETPGQEVTLPSPVRKLAIGCLGLLGLLVLAALLLPHTISFDTSGENVAAFFARITPMPLASNSEQSSTSSPLVDIGKTSVSGVDGATSVYVPAGQFLMGGENTGVDSQRHMVYLDSFWIDRTLVTNDQYKKCVDEGRCVASVCIGTSDHPVTCVTWQAAADYCAWAGRRLPTEAEWEKAARGIDGRHYPWGNEEPPCGKEQNSLTFLTQVYVSCRTAVTAVGVYPGNASPYGALDMVGNVSQWVQDWYDEDFYANSPERNPLGPASGQERIVRGSLINGVYYTQTQSRDSELPEHTDPYLGFRCAFSD